MDISSSFGAHNDDHRRQSALLSHCVADAALNAFGCVLAEAWAMSADGTRLERPGGGHWMDPVFAGSLSDEALEERAWDLDGEARHCAPGAGL